MAPKQPKIPKTDMDVVKAALETEVADSAVDTSLNMLRDALPYALSGGQQSHEYQLEVLRLVGAHLEALTDQARAAVEAQNKQVDVQRAFAAEAECQASSTSEAYDKSVEDANMLEAAVKESGEKVAVEEGRYKDTLKASKALISSMEQLEAQQVEIRELLTSLQDMHQGPLPRSAADAALDFLKEEGAEKTLIFAAADALMTDPAEAQAFDNVVKDAVVAAVRQKLQKLSSIIAERSQSVGYVKAENLGAWAIWECAQDRLVAAQSASAEAFEKQAEAKEASQAAKRNLKEQKASLSTALIEQTLAEMRLGEVQESQASFQRLQNPAPTPIADGTVEEQPCPVMVS